MYNHHREAIQIFCERMSKLANVQAVLIGGSIAHGFARETSDVDVMVVVDHNEFAQRLKESRIQFLDHVEGNNGRVTMDGKYISLPFMETISRSGGKPSRYAFEGAFAAFTRVEGIASLIRVIDRYPVEEKESKINRFYAQFKAWHYFYKDSFKKNNSYLMNLAISNLILFGGRLFLAYNETLYPFHKWFLRVLEQVPLKPEGLMPAIHTLSERGTKEDVDVFCRLVEDFTCWNSSGIRWPNLFLHDSEWNWLEGNTPVSDL